MKKPLLLIVCTGNICRSPMAVALLRAYAAQQGDAERYRIESAGTWCVNGVPASSDAQLTMQRRGLTLEGHAARTVSPELMREAAVILVMTRSHRDALGAEFPDARRKIHLFSELNGLEYDIADPYGRSLQTYETCADDLTALIERGYPRLVEWMEQRQPTPQR
ncbi:MAG: Protein-arginine-phosphatase [Anaerolineae bacterium]|nr:Protein-arginine-phosphatase [Anaerolineae bacterium]